MDVFKLDEIDIQELDDNDFGQHDFSVSDQLQPSIYQSSAAD